jgi:glutamate transport system permease protein
VTAPFVADALGPRGRRRVAVASVVAGAVIAAGLVVAANRLSGKGQLAGALWRPLRQSSVQRFLLLGLWTTVKTALVAMVAATVVGALLALGRLTRNPPVRWAAGAYVEFFRALPLILLMYFCALALPKYGIHLSPFQGVVLALTVYNGAVLGEIFRAGILSLDRGQREAGLAIGLSDAQTMRIIVLPQAVRRLLPSLISQSVGLLKDTSLGFIVSYTELLYSGRILASYNRLLIQTYIIIALVYIVINASLSKFARTLEARQGVRPTGRRNLRTLVRARAGGDGGPL